MTYGKVEYFYNPQYGAVWYGDQHPMKPLRMTLTHELLKHTGVLKSPNLTFHVHRPLKRSAMARFHQDDYLDFLARCTRPNEIITLKETDKYLTRDCPPFGTAGYFSALSCGGSYAAADAIANHRCNVAIHWGGGLHHARRTSASGFCYTNDIVIAILRLLETFQRVMYVDIDIHHGDGVEEAFYTTDRVLTFSLHKFGDFFPGTGDLGDIGALRGRGHALNFPLRDGITDDAYLRSAFVPVFDAAVEAYRPEAIVLQCGGDSLAGDALGSFNLSSSGPWWHRAPHQATWRPPGTSSPAAFPLYCWGEGATRSPTWHGPGSRRRLWRVGRQTSYLNASQTTGTPHTTG